MTFTQEKQINLRACNGCDKRCKLGISIESEQEAENATSSANRLFRAIGSSSRLPKICFAYPSIGGKRITEYYDQNGNYKTVGFDTTWLNQDDPVAREEYANKILDKAREIAKLCDHYKIR